LAAGPTDGGVADGSLEFAGAVVSTEIERTKQIIATIWIRIATSASASLLVQFSAEAYL